MSSRMACSCALPAPGGTSFFLVCLGFKGLGVKVLGFRLYVLGLFSWVVSDLRFGGEGFRV